MKHACKQASQLASSSLDRPLSLWERLKLKLHLAMCHNCQNHDHDLKLIQQVNQLMRETRYGQVRLSEAQRQRLSAELDRKITDL